MTSSDTPMIETLELLSDAVQPKPLFVLLHDAGGAALDMLALALSNAHDGLVGRVLAFGGGYAVLPTAAPKLITLHLLHGQLDAVMPAERIRQDYAHLMELGADATLDVASRLGHELHPALMDQAVTRLQTCVPLRFWKAA